MSDLTFKILTMSPPTLSTYKDLQSIQHTITIIMTFYYNGITVKITLNKAATRTVSQLWKGICFESWQFLLEQEQHLLGHLTENIH